MISDYATLDIKALGEAEIVTYGLSGKAADILRREHKELDNRFEQLKQNEEHKEWFFLGKPYEMHSFLFRTMFKTFMFEALLLIVLATALLTTYEFENKTHLLTYSTKRGRSLMKDKLCASLITGTAITTFLLLITLGTYFIVFDYTHLWGSSISSAFNWEYKMPYIPWWELSFVKFLLIRNCFNVYLSTAIFNDYICDCCRRKEQLFHVLHFRYIFCNRIHVTKFYAFLFKLNLYRRFQLVDCCHESPYVIHWK